MSAFDKLIEGMVQGREWELMGSSEGIRDLLDSTYDERYYSAKHHKDDYQIRVNMQKDASAASYAGWITADNPKSGPYQGTSFVWFPGEEGSVAVLVIGTDGFGVDASILGRPGHGRRLRAISRIHQGKVWVKPDLLDIATPVPPVVSNEWPKIPPALKAYDRVIYAAVAVRSAEDAEAVEDLLDLFFHEHATPLKGSAKERWEVQLGNIAGAIFPMVSEADLLALLRDRRFVILDGPPGTGKTHMAFSIAAKIGSSTKVQFHAARTYEDFVVGLFPRATEQGLGFNVRPGTLFEANKKAQKGEHVLVIDEINRADLARVLGEAVVLFEASAPDRSVTLPHSIEGEGSDFSLSPNLLVLGTRNTADRSIARMDIAIRRRFAFVDMWPLLEIIEVEDVPLASELFKDVIHTFAEFADDDTLRLVPGHAYFMDPHPAKGQEGKEQRIRNRLQYELLPLLRHYIDEKLCGNATEAISGLADRIEMKLFAS